MLGGAIGSVLGSAFGVTLVSTKDDPVSFGQAVAGAALGTLPAGILAVATGGFGLEFAVFSLTQGSFTSLVASRRRTAQAR